MTGAEEQPQGSADTWKVRAKRAELANAAMQTLAQRGYANTTLRDISRNSSYSHGILHYYFADKTDLIAECVRLFKEDCVRRYDSIVVEAATAADLRTAFARAMADTMTRDPMLHRLWYDLRTQCMYDSAFADDVAAIDKSLERMIWRVTKRYADMLDRPLAVSSTYSYWVFDGIFQHALTRHIAGNKNAATLLRKNLRTALDQLVTM